MSGKVRQSDILTALSDRLLGFLALRREVDTLRLSKAVGDRAISPIARRKFLSLPQVNNHIARFVDIAPLKTDFYHCQPFGKGMSKGKLWRDRYLTRLVHIAHAIS